MKKNNLLQGSEKKLVFHLGKLHHVAKISLIFFPFHVQVSHTVKRNPKQFYLCKYRGQSKLKNPLPYTHPSEN